jgi:hypothetical protein
VLRFVVYKSSTNKSVNSCVLKYPKFLVILGIIGASFCIGLNVAVEFSDKSQVYNIFLYYMIVHTGFTILTIGGFWMFLQAMNWQLILEEDCMIYRNLWGKSRKIEYGEITKIKTCNNKYQEPIKYIVYTGDRRIIVENFTINFNVFPNIMKKRLKQAKNTVQFS